ncbi:hypothetical protein BS47DRAFT_1338450 [Hydnum rufescens UP504]|uniref:Uncharacterized protein n=1 Tax=Hydnum rufescens UP504 TaxID=1448309 RepID=A0A9P6B5P1_9AGAM|nr:hypothetical protein BS47DRAFT_1338450 [Hydnum rufescens UP504]
MIHLAYVLLFLGVRASPSLDTSSSFHSDDRNNLQKLSLFPSSTSGYSANHTKKVLEMEKVVSSTTLYSVHSTGIIASESGIGTSGPVLLFTRSIAKESSFILSSTALETSTFLIATISTTTSASSTPSPSSSGSFASTFTRDLAPIPEISRASSASFLPSNNDISATPSRSVITTLIVFGVLASLIIGTFVILKCTYTAKKPSNPPTYPDLNNRHSISEPFPLGGSPRSAKYSYAFSGDGNEARHKKHASAQQHLLYAHSSSATRLQSTPMFTPQLPSTVQALERRRLKEDEDEKAKWLWNSQIY